jgi:hypothetical protein
MRADFPGGLSRLLWLAAAGALACAEPNAVSTEGDVPAPPGPRAAAIPPGFLELWRGGPVVPDHPRTRTILAAQARGRAAGMQKATRLSFAVAESSTAELLESGAAQGSQAMDVNRSGTVVGTVMDALPGGTPVTWSPGVVTPVPLPARPEWVDPLPAAINDAGDIVGDAQVLHPSGTHHSRVVRWGADGSLATLPPLAEFEQASYLAVDIASNGDIVGQTAAPFPPALSAHVILWHDGLVSDVTPADQGAVPIAINAGGTILAMLFSGPAVRRPDGTWTPLAPPPGDVTAFATDLGDDGTVVGGALDHSTSTYLIVRWAPDGTPAVIPPPAPGQHGFASAINYSGTILLTVFEAGGSVPGAYLLDGGDYSPLAADVPPDATGLTLTGLSDVNVAIGHWDRTFVRQAVRWTVAFPNAAPVAHAGGPYTAVEGSAVTFQGTVFDPTPTGTLLVSFDFGDGASGTGPTPAHVYADDGDYVAILHADDGEAVGADSAAVTVLNAEPRLTVPESATTTAGTPWTIQAAFTDAGALDGPWSYQIDWGDGGALATGSVPGPGPIPAARTYKQAGTFTVMVTLRDKDGGAATASYPVTVLKRNGRPRT